MALLFWLEFGSIFVSSFLPSFLPPPAPPPPPPPAPPDCREGRTEKGCCFYSHWPFNKKKLFFLEKKGMWSLDGTIPQGAPPSLCVFCCSLSMKCEKKKFFFLVWFSHVSDRLVQLRQHQDALPHLLPAQAAQLHGLHTRLQGNSLLDEGGGIRFGYLVPC